MATYKSDLPLNKYSAEMRERYLKMMSADKYKDVNAIFFSGGVDSVTILFSLLELGRKPELLSFHLEGQPSQDTVIGREIAEHYGLNYHCVELPVDLEQTKNDVETVKSIIKYPMKTHIQCSIPFLYMSREFSKLGIKKAFTGLAIGDIFANNKKCNIMYKEKGEEALRAYRHKCLFNPKVSDFDIHMVSRKYGIEVVDTLREDKEFHEWMLSIPYKELYNPKPKSVLIDAFREYWLLDEKNWYRPGNNLQIVSGIREKHDELFLNSEYNKEGAKAIIKIYNDIGGRPKSKMHKFLKK